MDFGKEGVKNKINEVTSTKVKNRSKFTILLTKVIIFGVVAVLVLGAIAVYREYRSIIAQVPDVETIDAQPQGYMSTVYDSDGNETAHLVASGSNRVYVTINQVPLDVQHAFVAIEDERFYEHNGIDIKGIIRAAIKGVANGFDFDEGASTITQQLLKNNVFSSWTSETTFREKLERKIQEQYLAVQLEKEYSKDKIMQSYLNTINLGQNCLGIQAAAKRYFDKDVSELTISEAAVIAAITKNPSKYNPISNATANKERRDIVLSKMLSLGFITQSEYETAIADEVYDRIKEVDTQNAQGEVYSYFVDELIEQVSNDLQEQLGYSESQAYNALYYGGLKIYSTQDSDLQKICDEEVANEDNYAQDTKYSFTYTLTIQKQNGSFVNYDENTLLYYYQASDSDYSLIFDTKQECYDAIRQYKKAVMDEGDEIAQNGETIVITPQPQTSLTLIDQNSGEVKALVGGRGEKTASRTLNRATDTTRQPGSTFKILAAFAPALDTGKMTLATAIDDAPYTYDNGTKLKNYDNRYRGYTTIREAITDSINVVTVKTLDEVTPQVGYEYLTSFGFTTLTESDIVQALALGGVTNGVTNLELAAAYGAIADGGEYTTPRFYTKIEDADGNVILRNSRQKHTVITPQTAYLLTDAMEDVVTKGTAKSVAFDGYDIAAKTGTTTNSRDSWLVGYTPYYTLAVWGGNDDNESLSDTTFTKKIWKNVMSRVHESQQLKEAHFEAPDGIVTKKICVKSGLLAISGVCKEDPRGSMVKKEIFADGTVPTTVCNHHVAVTICTQSGMLATKYCTHTTTKVYMSEGSDNTEDSKYILGSRNKYCTIHSSGTSSKTEQDDSSSNDKKAEDEVIQGEID